MDNNFIVAFWKRTEENVRKRGIFITKEKNKQELSPETEEKIVPEDKKEDISPREVEEASEQVEEENEESKEENVEIVEGEVQKETEEGVENIEEESEKELIDLGNGTQASIQKNGGYNEFYILDEDKEILVESIPVEYGGEEFLVKYDDIKVTEDRYLQYRVGGQEYFTNRIYDLEEEQQILNLPFANEQGFTNDEKYYFACTANRFGGEMYVDIYSVPDFEKIFTLENIEDFPRDVFIEELTCDYDKENENIKLEIKYCEKEGTRCSEESDFEKKNWDIDVETMSS
ncbi:MAG: hypothetical protein ABFQ53_03260, partial [Patescibacteria group bacterium]